jgi:hypothetical protein
MSSASASVIAIVSLGRTPRVIKLLQRRERDRPVQHLRREFHAPGRRLVFGTLPKISAAGTALASLFARLRIRGTISGWIARLRRKKRSDRST